jgi:hypothetical protein
MPDSNIYRSLGNTSIHPRDFINLTEQFRDGKEIGKNWNPPTVNYYNEPSENQRKIGHFPSCSSLFVIDKKALDILYPVINTTIIEILPLPSLVGNLSVLNIAFLDCIDHSKSKFEYFSSGKIMRVEKFALVESNLANKHIFRLKEESFAKVFADDTFKMIVEDNQLDGLVFYAVEHV